jgi:hypothetical protein
VPLAGSSACCCGRPGAGTPAAAPGVARRGFADADGRRVLRRDGGGDRTGSHVDRSLGEGTESGARAAAPGQSPAQDLRRRRRPGAGDSGAEGGRHDPRPRVATRVSEGRREPGDCPEAGGVARTAVPATVRDPPLVAHSQSAPDGRGEQRFSGIAGPRRGGQRLTARPEAISRCAAHAPGQCSRHRQPQVVPPEGPSTAPTRARVPPPARPRRGSARAPRRQRREPDCTLTDTVAGPGGHRLRCVFGPSRAGASRRVTGPGVAVEPPRRGRCMSEPVSRRWAPSAMVPTLAGGGLGPVAGFGPGVHDLSSAPGSGALD